MATAKANHLPASALYVMRSALVEAKLMTAKRARRRLRREACRRTTQHRRKDRRHGEGPRSWLCSKKML